LYPKVRLVNIEPFEEVEVEVKPLTVFIGRNSVGKSLIAQTLWALAIYLYPFSIYYWKAHRGIASSPNIARD